MKYLTRNNLAQPHYDPYHHRLQYVSDEMIEGWSEMVRCWIDGDGFGVRDPYFFSFMFDNIPGSAEVKWDVMKSEIQLAHKKLTRHIVRNPKNPLRTFLHPRCVVCPDYPVWKHKKVDCCILHAPNGGLHAHGIVVAPKPRDEELAAIKCPQSRLRETLDVHFETHHSHYTSHLLNRIHVEPIIYGTMTDYLFKTIKHGNASYDDVLLL